MRCPRLRARTTFNPHHNFGQRSIATASAPSSDNSGSSRASRCCEGQGSSGVAELSGVPSAPGPILDWRAPARARQHREGPRNVHWRPAASEGGAALLCPAHRLVHGILTARRPAAAPRHTARRE
jgi:hypothetical protein